MRRNIGIAPFMLHRLLPMQRGKLGRKPMIIAIIVWALLTWVVPTWVVRTNILPRGTNGIALAPFLVLVKPDANDATIRHEMVHVEQYRRLGWLGFYPVYFYWQYKVGYRKNPMEIEAYKRQNDI